MSSNTEVLERWFRRVWTEKDLSAIDDMFPQPAKAAGLGEQDLIGPDDFKQFQMALCEQVSEIEITIDKCLEEQAWVSALCTFKGKAVCGKRISITGTVFALIENDKIIQGYNHWDFISLWEQLGLLPSNCFANCLAGTKVGE